MAPPTKKRGISHGISFSTTKITLKIPTFSLLWPCGRGYPNLCDCANQRNGSFDGGVEWVEWGLGGNSGEENGGNVENYL
mgnify:CR=1 FL=1